MNFKKIFFAMVVFVCFGNAVAQTQNSKPAQTTEQVFIEKTTKCTKEALINGYGWSAAYGAGVMVIGGLIGVSAAPVSVPIGIAVLTVNAVTGGAIGLGASAITRISDDVRFEMNPVASACISKIKKELKIK
jgi:hypothetical protein